MPHAIYQAQICRRCYSFHGLLRFVRSDAGMMAVSIETPVRLVLSWDRIPFSLPHRPLIGLVVFGMSGFELK